jgi:hypothetical protein
VKNYTRAYRINQYYDAKVSTGETTVANFALSPSGRKTYIAGEDVAPVNPKVRGKKRKATPPWSPYKVWSVCNLRLNGVQRIIQGRHGGPVDTDDASTYFDVALVHLVARRVAMNHAEERIMSYEWAKKWTPLLAAEKSREWFIEQERRILNSWDDVRPYIPTADEVAVALQITAAEIKAHKAKTIGSVDRREGIRVREAKAKHAERESTRRATKGATARVDSLAQRKPWERHGMSRATYYRAIERGEIQPDPVMKKRAGKATTTGNVLRLVS